MMNLLPHHRLHIPNGLAVFAAVMLLVTSVVGFDNLQDTYPENKSITESSIVKSANDTDTGNPLENKRRGLKLGLLLFRR